MTTPATLTRDQLADIGAHTVLMCGTFQALGHVSPTGSAMDYVGPMDSESAEFVRCMFRVCVFGGDPESTAFLVKFAEKYALLDLIAEAVAR